MKDRYLLFVISLLFCCLLQAQEKIDSLLVVLDRTIENTAQYEQARLKRIDQIKEYFRTRKSTSPSDEYHINQQLFDEYEAYICDSARHYINRNIEIALQHNNQDWLNEAKLKKASILGKTGLYAEGVALLKSIDSKQLSRDQLIEYYITFEDIYLYHAEYAMDDEYQIEYLNNLYIYRDSVLQMVEEGAYQYVIAYTPELLQQGRGEEAIEMLEVYHQKLSPDTRDYAVVTSILAFIYQSTGQREKQKEYLIKSAIADIRGVVKENNSLRALAELLYEEGQLQRADVYMKRSMEDANFYNARLRNVQASRMLPVIDHAYQVEKQKHQQVLQIFLVVTSLLTLFLACAVWYVIRQVKKLARARQDLLAMNEELKLLNERLIEVNQRQHETNDSLTEANHIKEEYVGRFMGLCSTYVEDNTGWNALALYGYGEAAIGSSWPGIQVSETKEINGTTYKCFHLTPACTNKNINLIFNDNGVGNQLKDYNLTIDRDYYLRISEAGCSEIKDCTVYVQDNSGWEALTLYGWGDAAIGDSWPGIQVTGTREINGVTYKYFDLSEHVGKYSNLIFNNNGGGQQIEDGGLYTALIGDIYFSITATSYEKLPKP